MNFELGIDFGLRTVYIRATSRSGLASESIDRQLRNIEDKLSLRKRRSRSALEIVRLVSWTGNRKTV